MNSARRIFLKTLFIFLNTLFVLNAILSASDEKDLQKLMEEADIKGGLIVHAYCGDPSTGSGQAGNLTAAFG